MRRLSAVAVLVPDYDEALAFFVGKLGFARIEDSDLGGGKRWLRLGFPGAQTDLLVARAVGEQRAQIGQQGGGRVWLFLETDDAARDYTAWSAAGVVFETPLRHEPYGRVAVFRDPWGNRWDLIQYADPATRARTGG
jgi:catechol 2,3-dioxygenase-like lactoylglutathione lyase family enzyme